MNSFLSRPLIILLISMAPIAMYTINPFEVESQNIRPRLFGFDLYRIPSKSMLPTLVPGDYILTSNFAYLNRDVQRKDIIVFSLPSKKKISKRSSFIKRVIATQGDTVSIRKGIVFINKKALKEEYLMKDSLKKVYSREMNEVVTPPGKLFVLGDNRDNSSDSRIFGFISTDDVIAKATTILYGKNGRSGKAIK